MCDTHESTSDLLYILIFEVSIQLSEWNDLILFCLLYYSYIICTYLVQFDITKLRNLIVSKINDNYAGLHRLVETSLPNFTIEMFQVRLTSEGIRDKSTPDNILKEFINGMDWINNQLDMKEHCKKFLKVCNKIGGSCIPASKTLKYQWIESVKQEMGVSLSQEN